MNEINVDLVIQKPKASWTHIDPIWLNKKKEFSASFGNLFHGHYIKDGFIEKLPSAEEAEYDPFYYYRQVEIRRKDKTKTLYLKFININENDEGQILDFVDDYGFLGVYHYKYDGYVFDGSGRLGILKRQQNGFRKLVTLEDNNKEIDFLGWSESTADFKECLIKFRSLVDLYHAINNRNEDGLRITF